MDIKREEIGTLNEVITINFEPNDYQEKVEKSLKNIRQKASEPGFRPGHVPAGLINKKYGKAVLADEISKMTNDEIFNYLKTNNINILFEPIALPEKTVGDFDKAENFSFAFEIGIRPETTIDYESAKKINDYHITATDEEVNTEIAAMRKRVGKFSSTEEIKKEDMLMATVVPQEGESFTSSLIISYLTEEKANELVGKKLHDEFPLDIEKDFLSDYERSTFLKVKIEELATAPKQVTIKVDAIHHIEPADLDEKFFSSMYPDGSVKDEAALKEKIKSQVELRYVNDANAFYRNKVMETLVEKSNIQLPDEFIKKYLVESDKKYTTESINEKYADIRLSIVYQLLEDQIAKDCEININREEVLAYIKNYIRLSYFGGVGEMSEEQEKQIDRFTAEMVKNQENFKNAYENIFFDKITEGLRTKLAPKVKKMNYKAFVDEVSGTKKPKATKKATKDSKETKEE